MNVPVDPSWVVAIVAIINAAAAGISLVITTWFAAQTGPKALDLSSAPPKGPDHPTVP